MQRKIITTIGIIVGVLALLLVLVWPAAPLWARLGMKPVCIQGSWPDLKVVSCTPQVSAAPVSAPRALPTLSGQAPVPVIVDDDGSPDGMIALLFFLRNPLFDVKAVTVSCGEAHPDLFAPRVQQLLAGLGRANIPVGVGRTAPLAGNNVFPDPWRKASDDFWGIDYPTGAVSTKLIPAAELIVETLNNSTQPVMVFVSGNHTNLAEALRIDPGITQHIRDIHIMGGSIYAPGNIKSDWPSIDNSVAEWNIWVDPIAASEVFASGVPLHLSPLDATNQMTWTEADALSWTASGTPEGVLAADILRWMITSWSSSHIYIWDLVAAVNSTDPTLCPEVSLAVGVLVAPGPTQGQTVVAKDQAANTSVCLKPDSQQVKSLADAVLRR